MCPATSAWEIKPVPSAYTVNPMEKRNLQGMAKEMEAKCLFDHSPSLLLLLLPLACDAFVVGVVVDETARSLLTCDVYLLSRASDLMRRTVSVATPTRMSTLVPAKPLSACSWVTRSTIAGAQRLCWNECAHPCWRCHRHRPAHQVRGSREQVHIASE